MRTRSPSVEETVQVPGSGSRRVPLGGMPGVLLGLQAAAGNQAVSSLLAQREVSRGSGRLDPDGSSETLSKIEATVASQSAGSLCASRRTDTVVPAAILPMDNMSTPSCQVQRKQNKGKGPTEEDPKISWVGNRALQRLLAVQREPSPEQKKEFDGYVAQRDWGRAAWVLNNWDPGDIDARLKRSMPAAHLEALTEGAWFSGKDNVDAAVKKLDPVARAKGAMRVLVPWKHWDEAAKVLEAVPHREAMAYVKDLAAKGVLTNADLRALMRTAPNLHLRPGDALTVGGVEFVVYAGEVRAGGDPAWRNNNPGNLRTWPGADAAWGSIGVASSRFLVFPDRALGFEAIKKNFDFKLGKLKDPTILAMMENYAPAKDGNHPDVYADNIVKALGGDASRETHWSTLSASQRETARGVVVHTEREDAGETFTHESPKLPVEVREILGK